MIPLFFRLIATAQSTAMVNCPSNTNTNGATSCDTGLPKVTASKAELHNVLTIVFGIAALLSVLMMVVGGLMFVTSGGNSENAAKARETIIYAAVGLVVSLSSVAIVQFALGYL